MRKIFNIARTELHTLFYSPVAWLMLALFSFITGFRYIGRISAILRESELGGFYAAFVEHLSRRIIYQEEASLFYRAINNLYIFLPLLTMGLISRELSSGTIKLLYSSPLRIREIVLGKYLAIVSFALCMTAIAGLIVTGLCFTITNPDIPQLIASTLGLFLIMCCFAAVGLFISSLTSYQVGAAIITCVVLGFLKQSSSFFPDIEVINSITYYLNIPDKSAYFLSGLINSKDFFYFLILIGTFLTLTMVRLKSGAESISKKRLAVRYVAVIAVAALAGYITTRKSLIFYLDTTRGQDFTISKPTQDLLKQLDAHEFDVTLYVNILDGTGKELRPENQNFIERVILEPYYRFKPNMKVNFVYYYHADSTDYRFQLYPDKSLKEIAQNEAKQLKMRFSSILSVEEVSRLVDVKSELYRNFFHIRYGDEQMIVRTFDTPPWWPSEYEFSAAWQRQVINPPKVVFLSGERERSPFNERRYNYSLSTASKPGRYSLLNQGFDVDTLSLTGGDVPQDIATLVVADPRVPLSTGKIEKISRYIDNGGNLLLLTEPDSWKNAQPLLEKLGITIKPGLIVQKNDYLSNDNVFPNVTDSARHLSPFFLRSIKSIKKVSGDTVVTIKMPTVSALEYKPVDGFTVEPMLVSDGKYSWNRIKPIPKDSLQIPLGKATGDEHGDFVTSVRMYRNVNGKEQRIIVASDADYPSDDGLNQSKFGFEYQLWCYRYFTYGKFPTMMPPVESLDDGFKITRRGINVQRILFVYLLPGILSVTGIVILIRRKRK